MDKEEYIKKADELLNQETYKIIPADPTTKQNKLISLLKNIKAECGVNEDTYKKIYPTVLWAAKDPQGRSTPKTNCLQQRFSVLWNS